MNHGPTGPRSVPGAIRPRAVYGQDMYRRGLPRSPRFGIVGQPSSRNSVEEAGTLAENGFRETRIKVRGPLTGLWRIALYYALLFTLAYFLARFSPIFEEVVFGGWMVIRLSASFSS